ncbi:MAG: hypothetical protein MJ156_00925 [Alphaproteobacteria bacterium]|nr:hypothetical protein [Alphaproteobacteria bacterium]
MVTRERSLNSDANEFRQDKMTVDVYAQMGKLPEEDYSNKSASELIDLIAAVGKLTPKEAKQFENLFAEKVLSTPEFIEQLPPKVVTSVYEYVKNNISEEQDDQKRQDLITKRDSLQKRIDFLISDFDHVYDALSFVDNTNTPDVYAGYTKMLDVRGSDEDVPANIQELINKDREKLEKVYSEYKKYYNIDWITPKDAPKLEERLTKVQKQLDSINISDEYMDMTQNYSFVDSEGKEDPQFLDKDGQKNPHYAKGVVVDPKSRLNSLIQLAKQSVAMQHLDGKAIDKKEMQKELDESFIITLYSTAKNHGIQAIIKDKQDASENSEYDESKTLEEIKQELITNGGTIDPTSFEDAMDNQCNRVAGFAQCIDQETRKPDEESKTGNFFTKLFNPIQKIDKRAKDRLQEDSRSAKRLSRLNLLGRVFKMFGCGFLASLLLTFSASAAGQFLGVSSSVIGSIIGGTVAVGFSIAHIVSWVKARKARGEPHGFKDFLKDPRMLSALAPTLLMLASFACLAAGQLVAAKWLGRAAIVIGASVGGISLGKDARNSGYSRLESIVWGIAGFAGTFGGGFAGRAAGTQLAEFLGEKFPDVFQHKEETITKHIERQYDPRALDNARHICEQWYQDNPTELQHRVDLINQYNELNGTKIDPYRAIMLSADAGAQTFDNMGLHIDGGGVHHSGGHHTVFGAEWQHTKGFSASEIHDLAHMFDGGQVNPDAISVASRIDPMISIHNEVGVVPSSDQIMHHDHVLWDNYTNSQTGEKGFNTYNGGDAPYIEHEIIDHTVEYTPDINPMLGAFGTYQDKVYQQSLKDRVGSFADKLHQTFVPKPKPQPDPVPVVKKYYINRANAKKWLETPVKLDGVLGKLHGKELEHHIAEALHVKRKTNNQIINTIRNQYPELTDRQIDEMVAETFRREMLEDVLSKYENFESGEENFQHHYGKDVTNPRHKEREQERQWWLELIQALGGKDSLNDSEYYLSKSERESQNIREEPDQVIPSRNMEQPAEEIEPSEQEIKTNSVVDIFKKGSAKIKKRLQAKLANLIGSSEKL